MIALIILLIISLGVIFLLWKGKIIQAGGFVIIKQNEYDSLRQEATTLFAAHTNGFSLQTIIDAIDKISQPLEEVKVCNFKESDCKGCRLSETNAETSKCSLTESIDVSLKQLIAPYFENKILTEDKAKELAEQVVQQIKDVFDNTILTVTSEK